VHHHPLVQQVAEVGRKIVVKPLNTQRTNNQFCNGSWVFIAHSDISPCPVTVIEKYIKMGRHDSNSRLFCQIEMTKKSMELRKEPMSYSQASELTKQELQKERLDLGFYDIHSLREGEASAAAALGTPDRLFQQQGGWHSEKSKNKYIQEPLESLLKVTKTIEG